MNNLEREIQDLNSLPVIKEPVAFDASVLIEFVVSALKWVNGADVIKPSERLSKLISDLNSKGKEL